MHTTSRHRVLGTVAGVIIGSALLAGCTTQPASDPTPSATTTKTATPTPSATSTAVAAPKSDDEAQTEAGKTLQREVAAANDALNNNGEGMDEVAKYATGPALQTIKQSAEASRLDKTTRSGKQVMTVLSGYSGELVADGTKVPFGSVTLSVCNDTSDVKYVKADGSENQRPASDQTKLNVSVIYSPADHAWFVRNFEQVATSC
ncbi:hypothetical protein LQK89_17780 (plasmid) [Curtobacterium sp. C1]|uniref:hypothetical protein n=1 Tax=Curtobacterium sp. C1 TaxID=2898151 RepID=UPI001E5297C9|nr:hypothetical protein [Curtobacterium sp. C1]UFU16073.1 hypothetical protein LQK89_17780 [Curtobacterium sp. C1]